MAGYGSQYMLAAEIILHALQNDELEWIRIADPDAGRVDDFVIGTPFQVDAYQFKWSTYPGTFTFNDLAGSSGKQPILIAQLADGWRRLREMYGHERHVVVHLTTNEIPSPHGKIATSDPPPQPAHFAAFIEQAWKPTHQAAGISAIVPQAWRPSWDALQTASGLDQFSFEAFVAACELGFGQVSPIKDGTDSRIQHDHNERVRRLAQFLMEGVANPRRIVQLSRDELLTELGWSDRYSFRYRHDFPVDEELYEPVEVSARQLDTALEGVEGGYIAVIGTPGSGKSTLLTQALRRRPERVVRYYAYVPDSADPVSPRGESEHFLHDVVLSLRHAGFRPASGGVGFDRDALLQEFHQQLRFLHSDWQSTGRKTILAVDGLDHIEREQRPSRSLLFDLPMPDQVPEGVLIVVGSQTDAVLPSRIQHSVRQQGRRIVMQPLSREAVIGILRRAQVLDKLTPRQVESVCELSSGHPLALMYLVRALAHADDGDARAKVLKAVMPYDDTIAGQYHAFWRAIEESSPDIAHTLSIAARMRRFLDLEVLAKWYGVPVVQKIRQTAWQYFRQETESRWYFFHNSFRLFIVDTTGPGESAVDCELHSEIAVHCAREPFGSFWAWEELFHRAMTGDHTTVIERATQAYFREQARQLRPLDAVQADVVVALRSARAKSDVKAFAQLVFAAAEADRRQYHLSDISLVELLLQLGKTEVAAEYVRSGNRLRVKSEVALEVCPLLFIAGLPEESRRVFDLAEPIELSASSEPLTEHQLHDGSVLRSWAEAAVLFNTTRQVIDRIRRIERDPDPLHQQSAAIATRDLQNSLLFQAGLGLLRFGRWEDLSEILSEFDVDSESDRLWWFWLQARAWRSCEWNGDLERAISHLQETLNVLGDLGASLDDPEARTILAAGLLRILGDADNARIWLGEVSQPERPGLDAFRQEGMQPFRQRLELNRLLIALEIEKTPSEIIPDAVDPRDQGLVYFERGICILARLWGIADRGQRLDLGSIQQDVSELMQIFDHPAGERHQWTGWYLAAQARGEFYAYLVHAAAGHGSTALDLLRDNYEREWARSATANSWPSDAKRHVALAFAHHEGFEEWVRTLLHQLSDGMRRAGGGTPDRLAEHLKQAEAWLEVGERTEAERELDLLAQLSFGPRLEEDYQLDNWAEWLGRANALDPDLADERIAWFARAIMAFDQFTEGSVAQSASNELLRVTFRHSPQLALKLYLWLLEHRLINFGEAAEALLQAALDGPFPPHLHVEVIAREVILPTVAAPKPDVLVRLLQSLASQSDEANVARLASAILVDIDRTLPSSRRAHWKLTASRGLHEIGLAPESFGLHDNQLMQIASIDTSSSSDTLRLIDGTELNAEQVAHRVSSIADFASLRAAQAAGSYFNWKPVLVRLAEGVSLDTASALAEMARRETEAPQILSSLGARLLDLGHRSAALQLAEEAFRRAEPYSWIPGWYYTGAKLDAARTMIAVSGESARERAWDALTDDLTSGTMDWFRLQLEIDRVLAVVAPDVDPLALWPIVVDHVEALLSGADISLESPTFDVPAAVDDSAGRALVDFLITHIDHPVNALHHGAKRALVRLLIARDPACITAISELSGFPQSRQQQLLAVVEVASREQPGLLQPLLDAVQSVSESPNHAIRQLARQLAQLAGHDPLESTSAAAGVLPAVYRLSFPEGPESTLQKPLDLRPGAPLPTAGTPEELIAPFDEEYERVASLAGVEFEALCVRATQLIPDLRSTDPWVNADEAQLMGNLHSSGLRLPWRRPRAALARRALDNIVVELTEAGRLESNELRQLDRQLRWYDPALIMRDPIVRPLEIPPIVSPTYWSEVSGVAWLNEVDADAALIVDQLDDGRIVLAEHSELRLSEHGRPTSLRRSAVAAVPTDVILVEPLPNLPIARVFNRILNDYAAGTVVVKSDGRLVIENDRRFIDQAGTDWFALHPDVGLELGWVQDPAGLFRWRDQSGNLMVESIWWADGQIDQAINLLHPFHSELGEGWLVVATPEAVACMVGSYPRLRRFSASERQFTTEQDLMRSQSIVQSVLLRLP